MREHPVGRVHTHWEAMSTRNVAEHMHSPFDRRLKNELFRKITREGAVEDGDVHTGSDGRYAHARFGALPTVAANLTIVAHRFFLRLCCVYRRQFIRDARRGSRTDEKRQPCRP